VVRNPRLVLGALTRELESAGLGTETAQRAATEIPLRGERFLSFTARTVFGLDPDELGSPRVAALSSLALFSVGALVPLLPWFAISGSAAIASSVVLTVIASVIVGGWVSRSSGNRVATGALRQLLIVIAASAVTYTIGKLFGTVVA
jgi:VIT1/CCC1 family predicted Fe2+/Mn2+ transporter